MKKAYIQNHYKVLPEQYDYMKRVTDELNFNEDTRHFVNHITVCAIQNMNKRKEVLGKEELASPISSVLIREKLRKTKLNDAAKMLEIKPYSYIAHVCREYAPQSWYLDEFLNMGAKLSVEEYMAAVKVNLFTGKLANAPTKSVLYDENRNPEPDLITGAINVIAANGCKFNKDEVQRHLNSLFDEMAQCSKEYGAGNSQYIRAKGRYRNDASCTRAFLSQNPTLTKEPDICIYNPAYAPAYTGRISQHLGGLQSCSRRMKKAAYSGIPGLKNFDLKSSQLCALVLELLSADIDPSWLIDYISDSDSKYKYATKAGMSVGCWKQCVLALVMGAKFPEGIGYKEIELSKILETLLKETDGDLYKANNLRIKLKHLVYPLIEKLTKWHDYLLANYVEKNKKISRNGPYITNAVGKNLHLSDLNLKSRGRRKSASIVSAFLLQGIEAAFIHNLTINSPKYGYTVMSNEHDGLVTIGDIPQEAVAEAKRNSGFQNAEIVEKDFV